MARSGDIRVGGRLIGAIDMAVYEEGIGMPPQGSVGFPKIDVHPNDESPGGGDDDGSGTGTHGGGYHGPTFRPGIHQRLHEKSGRPDAGHPIPERRHQGPTFRPGLRPRGKAPLEKPEHFTTADVHEALAGRGSRGGSAFLKGQRARYMQELKDNPALRDKVMRIAANEQGSHPEGTQAVIESMMNRAAQRGTSLEQQARWHGSERGGYYAMGSMGRGALEDPKHRAILEHSLEEAGGGSNISNLATDNASGSFGRGEIESGKFKFRSTHGGEIFSSPGAAEPKYAQDYEKMYGGGAGPPAGKTRLAADPNYQEPAAATTKVGGGGANHQSNLDYLTSRGGHSTVNMKSGPVGAAMGVDPEFAARMTAAGKAYESETGKPAKFGETDRDAATQAVYYNRYLHGGGIAAHPPDATHRGSMHQHGLASDVPRGGFVEWLQSGGAARHGLGFPVHGDPNHMQMVGQGDRRYYTGEHPTEQAKHGGSGHFGVHEWMAGGEDRTRQRPPPIHDRHARRHPSHVSSGGSYESRNPERYAVEEKDVDWARRTNEGDLDVLRRRFGPEMRDPKVRQRLFSSVMAETGALSTTTQQAYMETVFNRAVARNQTLLQTINQPHYYPKTTTSKLDTPVSAADAARLADVYANVHGGSNVSRMATGNASAPWPGSSRFTSGSDIGYGRKGGVGHA